MTVGEDEAVTFEPALVLGVVPHDVALEWWTEMARNQRSLTEYLSSSSPMERPALDRLDGGGSTHVLAGCKEEAAWEPRRAESREQRPRPARELESVAS